MRRATSRAALRIEFSGGTTGATASPVTRLIIVSSQAHDAVVAVGGVKVQLAVLYNVCDVGRAEKRRATDERADRLGVGRQHLCILLAAGRGGRRRDFD